MEILFDKFANLPALEKERDRILSLFADVKKGILELSGMGLKIDQSKGLGETNKALKEYEGLIGKISAAQKQLEDINRKLTEAQKELTAAQNNASGSLNVYSKAYKDVLGDIDQNIKKQEELRNKLKQVQADLKNLRSFATADQSGNASAEIVKLAKEEAELKNQITYVTAAIKAQTAEQLSNNNSIEEARARLKLLRKERDAQNVQSEGGRSRKEELNAEIDALDAFIEKETDLYTKRKINIGNYQGSAKIIVNALKDVEKQLENLKQKQQGLQNLSQTNPIGFKLQGGADELNKVNAQLAQTEKQFTALNQITSQPQFLNIAGRMGDATAETRYFTKALIELEQQGQKDSTLYKELQTRLAELTDQIADTRQEVKALSSDTRSFDLFASGVGTLASSFQVAASAAQVFGGENEEVQKSIQRLLAIQAISNGVRQIATDLTTRGSAANKLYAFTQNLVTTAMNGSATAATRLKAAMGLLGIALTVVGALIIAYQAMKKTTEDVVQKQNKLNEVFADAKSQYAAAATQVKSLNQQLQLAKEGFVSKDKVVKEYNETIGKTVGQAKNLDQVEQLLAKNAEAYVKFTLLKAAANIALQKAAEKAFVAQELSLFSPKTTGKDEDIPIIKNGKVQMQKASVFIKGLVGAYKKDVEKEQEDLETISNDLLKQAQGIAAKFNFNFGGDAGGAKTESQLSKYLSEEQKAGADLIIFRKQLAIEESKAIADAEELTSGVRVAAKRKQLQLEKELLELEKQQAIKAVQDKAGEESKKATSEEKKAIAGRLSKELEKIEVDYSKRSADIEADRGVEVLRIRKQADEKIKAEAEETQKQLGESIVNKQVEQLQNTLSSRQQIIDINARRELKTQIENLEKGVITKEQFEARRLAIEDKANKESLQAQIDYYRQLVLIMDLPEDKKKEALDKLADYEKQVNQKSVDDLKASVDQKVSLLQQLRDGYKDLGLQILETFTTLLSGAVDAQKNEIQEQIDLIERRKNAEIDAINQTTTANEDKAARIKIVEARAQAQREELDRKQRDLDRKKAVYERAFRAFQIGAAGIEAVAKIKANVAVLLSNPLTAPYAPIAAAQIPITIASTAAQLVALLATPIPKYARGTKSSHEGFAEVAEEGPELGIDPSGKTMLFPKRTITYLKKGTQILPAHVTRDVLAANSITYAGATASDDRYGAATLDKLDKVNGQLKELNRKSRIVIYNQSGIESTPYYQYHMKH